MQWIMHLEWKRLKLSKYLPLVGWREKLGPQRRKASCRQCAHSLHARPTALRSMTSPQYPCSHLRQHQREGAWP